MQTLNGKKVLNSGSGLFMSGDVFSDGVSPILSFMEGSSLPMDISVAPNGDGFIVTLNSFSAGMTMTSNATGTLRGREIIIRTVANRIAEMNQRAMYIVHYIIAEK